MNFPFLKVFLGTKSNQRAPISLVVYGGIDFSLNSSSSEIRIDVDDFAVVAVVETVVVVDVV